MRILLRSPCHQIAPHSYTESTTDVQIHFVTAIVVFNFLVEIICLQFSKDLHATDIPISLCLGGNLDKGVILLLFMSHG